MSDEIFFQAALDASPNDLAARLLLAEWLEARGDWRADGYAWMARHCKRPLLHPMLWKWWTIGMYGTPSAIDDAFEQILDGFAEKGESRSVHYRTRNEAEEAVCRALAELNRRGGLEALNPPAQQCLSNSIDDQGCSGQAKMQR